MHVWGELRPARREGVASQARTWRLVLDLWRHHAAGRIVLLS